MRTVIRQSTSGDEKRHAGARDRRALPAHELGFNYFLEFALAVGTLQRAARFQPFLEQVRAAAVGTFLGHRFGPCHEIAIRIAAATIERFTALRSPFHHFAFGAVGALHADGLLLDELTSRIIAARRELAVAPVLHHQIVATVRALLI